MKISRAVFELKNSINQGLNPSMEDYTSLRYVHTVYHYVRKTSKINLSAVLQIESLVRVLLIICRGIILMEKYKFTAEKCCPEGQ